MKTVLLKLQTGNGRLLVKPESITSVGPSTTDPFNGAVYRTIGIVGTMGWGIFDTDENKAALALAGFNL